MLKRILPVILTVSVLLCCMLVSASAVAYDYNDYITDIKVDGDNDICTVVLPFTGRWYVGHYVNGSMVIDGYIYGNDVDFQLEPGIAYSIGLSPIASSLLWDPPVGSVFGEYGIPISLDNLPSGSTLQLYCDMGISNDIVSVGRTSTMIYYVNEQDGEYFLAEPFTHYTNENVISDDFDLFSTSPVITLENKTDAFGYSFWFREVQVSYSGSTNLHAEAVLTFSISSAYREYTQSGKNQALMKAIEAELKSNGQTLQGVLDQQKVTNSKLDSVISSQDRINEYLDDFKNYEVQGIPPAGSDIVDDYESAEDQLMDSVAGGSSEFENMTLTAWDRIYTYQQSFLAFSSLFGLFADIPFFQSLLYISLTLGASAFFLGLGTQAARYFDRHYSSAGPKRRGG